MDAGLMSKVLCLEEDLEHLSELLDQRYQQSFQNKGFEPRWQLLKTWELYWAGEYAILEPGQLALIKTIPIYMTAEIKASNNYRLYSDMFSYSVTYDDSLP